MLGEREYGYAVMNKEITSISFEHFDVETCKRYCRNGNVVARRFPVHCGFEIKIYWFNDWSWSKPISFKSPYLKNVFWLYWAIQKSYIHKTGEIVYTSQIDEKHDNS